MLNYQRVNYGGIWGSKFWRQPLQITVNHRTIHGSKWAMFNSNVLNAQTRIHLDPVKSPCFMMKSHQNPIVWYFSWRNPMKSHQNPIFSYFSWRNPIRIPCFHIFHGEILWNPIRIPMNSAPLSLSKAKDTPGGPAAPFFHGSGSPGSSGGSPSLESPNDGFKGKDDGFIGNRLDFGF